MNELIPGEEFARIFALAYVITLECVERTEPEKDVIVISFNKELINKVLSRGGWRETDDEFYEMIMHCVQESESRLTCFAFLFAHNFHHWLEIKRSELQ